MTTEQNRVFLYCFLYNVTKLHTRLDCEIADQMDEIDSCIETNVDSCVIHSKRDKGNFVFSEKQE
jgi:hypothetical protein